MRPANECSQNWTKFAARFWDVGVAHLWPNAVDVWFSFALVRSLA